MMMNVVEYDEIPQEILDELIQYKGGYEPFHYGENINTLSSDERKLVVSLKSGYVRKDGELSMFYLIRGVNDTPFKLFAVSEAGYIKPNPI